ncbi:Rta1 domain-containing protein [Pleurostoma richardsiae]|uniref:Rta1 domain-containing protein n=1 Tax=Pleurostoma richardsiae TaxID=41990 RepID=A0AA38VH05_9PEZI|nr:Rta1 domain-containing protein [Pleurostoma richardsiae]
MAVGEFIFYHYNPSLAAAAVFIVLFSLAACGHTFQLLRSRTLYFIPFLIGCVFEAVGYVGRAISATQSPNWTTIPYIIQSLLLLLGPTLLAASIYMVLSRLITLLQADSYSLIRPHRLTKAFVSGDVVSFLAQSGGGGMLSNVKTLDDQKKGQNIIIGGLGIQIIFFGFFMVVTFVFHRRIVTNPTPRSLSILVPWQKYIFILYASSVFIMIRSVFRIVEYISGADGTLQSTEVYIYVFDASLMFIVAALFNVYHPSRIISGKRDRFDVSDNEEGPEVYRMNTRRQQSNQSILPDASTSYYGGYTSYDSLQQQQR